MLCLPSVSIYNSQILHSLYAFSGFFLSYTVLLLPVVVCPAMIDIIIGRGVCARAHTRVFFGGVGALGQCWWLYLRSEML